MKDILINCLTNNWINSDNLKGAEDVVGVISQTDNIFRLLFHK